ncbi:AAA family ATPase [Streptomyces sp. NPDC088341]|uniref:AAA family ATPase n=1 Tax=Streptomyces sp. NPDC088341 TaxID=3154870 RepID=UPI00344263A7
MGTAGEHGEAFVVCVDEYDHEAGARLAPARRAAEDFRGLARGLGFTADAPVISGTKQEIDDGLGRIEMSTAGRKLIYWVGHGVKIGASTVMLPCRDYRHGGRRGLFSAKEIGLFLTGLSGDVVLIVDTCHATDFAREAQSMCEDKEERYSGIPRGPDGSAGPGRGIGCLGTVGGDDLAQVGEWLAALKSVCGSPSFTYRGQYVWNKHAKAVSAEMLSNAVHQALRETSTVEPWFKGGGRLEGFFVNRHFDPFARPASATAPERRDALLGEQIQYLLKSRFTGLRLEEEDATFVGRRHSLSRITHWLSSPGRSGVMVVTGAPGSGKSALLGQTALMTVRSTPQYEELTPDQRGLLEGALVAGIQCRGRSALECARELAAGLDVKEPGTGWTDAPEAVRAVIEACRRRGEAAFLVDGLDEAGPAHVDAVIADVLRPLAQEPSVRILVGTRPTISGSLLMLDGAVRLDLDEDPDKDRDIAEYVRGRLGAPGCPYADSPELREAATRVLVDQSQGVFLVAQLHCSALARLERALPPGDAAFRRLLMSGLEEALDREVNELDRVAEAALVPGVLAGSGWARGLLLPLALSYGAGLPLDSGIWLAAAQELAGPRGQDAGPRGQDIGPRGQDVRYTPDDLRAVLGVAGAHIVEHGEGGQPVYRLGHEAMAEHLVESAGAVRELHGAMTDVLLRVHHTQHRGRGGTNPYIARYATAHAAAADRLDELVVDGEFLVNADPERLIVLLDRPRDGALPEATLYRGVAEELTGKSPAERAALLQATALCQRPELRAWARAAGSLPWQDRWTTSERSAPTRTLRVPYGDVRAVAIGPAGDTGDGDLLAAGEQLWRWPLPGGKPEILRRYVPAESRLGPNRLHALAAAPRKLSVAAVAADAERVLIWPDDTDHSPREFGWGAPVGDVAVGGRGHTEIVAATSGGSVAVWECLDGRPRHRGFWRWPHHGQVYGVAVAELDPALDGGLYVVAAGDGGAVVWDAHTGERVLSFGGDGGRAEALAITAPGWDPHIAIVGTTRPQLRVWRIAGGPRPRAERVHTAGLRSPSGSSVALGRRGGDLLVSAVDGGTVRLWRVRDDAELPALTGHRSRPTSLAFLPGDTGTVVVADGPRIRVWEQTAAAVRTGTAGARHGLPSPGSEHVGAMTASAPGRGAVVLAAGDTARLWDLTGRHLLDETGLSHISSVDLRTAPDGADWLAVGGEHREYGPCVRVRRLPDGPEATLRLDPRHDSSVGAVALTTGGGAVRVLAAADRYVRRWDVGTGERLGACHVATGMVEHLVVAETDGAAPFLLATAGNSVWAWEDAEPGVPLRFRLPGGGPARAVAGAHDARGGRRIAVATSAGVFTGSLDEPAGEDGQLELRPLSGTVTDVHSLAFRATASGRLVVLAACRSRVVHEWVVHERPGGERAAHERPAHERPVHERAVDRPVKDRTVTDRGYEVYGVLAAPDESGLLVAAVGLERMDLLRLDERRG